MVAEGRKGTKIIGAERGGQETDRFLLHGGGEDVAAGPETPGVAFGAVQGLQYAVGATHAVFGEELVRQCVLHQQAAVPWPSPR